MPMLTFRDLFKYSVIFTYILQILYRLIYFSLQDYYKNINYATMHLKCLQNLAMRNLHMK